MVSTLRVIPQPGGGLEDLGRIVGAEIHSFFPSFNLLNTVRGGLQRKNPIEG